MNFHLLLLLLWLLASLAAWLWMRADEEEQPLVNNTSLTDRIRFALIGLRAISRHVTDASEQRILGQYARRSRIGSLVIVLPITIYGAVIAFAPTEEEPFVEAIEILEDKEQTPEPEVPKPKLRTYVRGPSGKSQLNPEAEPETLEERRTPTRLYATAKVKPLYANEDLLGIQILRVDDASFWEIVGFKTDDFILEVNGQLMNTPAASVSFMNAMNTSPELIIRVRGRNDEERVLVFNQSDHEDE
ncbi:MAG: hypothetical protein OSB60_09435 [Myxococcota bacterium]|nr:hypothetical protein [Myxococcota bacterium]